MLCYAEQYTASSPGACSLGTCLPASYHCRGRFQKELRKNKQKHTTCKSALTFASREERFCGKARAFFTCVFATAGFASANSRHFLCFIVPDASATGPKASSRAANASDRELNCLGNCVVKCCHRVLLQGEMQLLVFQHKYWVGDISLVNLHSVFCLALRGR